MHTLFTHFIVDRSKNVLFLTGRQGNGLNMTFCGPASDTLLSNQDTEKLNFDTKYITNISISCAYPAIFVILKFVDPTRAMEYVLYFMETPQIKHIHIEHSMGFCRHFNDVWCTCARVWQVLGKCHVEFLCELDRKKFALKALFAQRILILLPPAF